MDRDLIQLSIRHLFDLQSSYVEIMCEKSLVDPEQRGVLVVEDRVTSKISVSLSSDVPYGFIYRKTI